MIFLVKRSKPHHNNTTAALRFASISTCNPSDYWLKYLRLIIIMYDVGALGRFNGGNRLNFVRAGGLCVCITVKSEKLLNNLYQIVAAN